MAKKNTYLRAERALNPTVLEAERVRLRPFANKDVESFWQMRSSPEVMEFIPVEVATDKAAVYQEFADDLAAGERFKFFNAVEWKNPPPGKEGFMIGWVLFRPTEDGRFVELGYWFLPEAWGKGLATEASKAMVEGHRAAMDVPYADIYAEAYVGNHASRNVLEKVGLEVRCEGEYDGKPTWVMHWKG
jgi:ribosomal-protein-alanine N-acetyltransferase